MSRWGVLALDFARQVLARLKALRSTLEAAGKPVLAMWTSRRGGIWKREKRKRRLGSSWNPQHIFGGLLNPC